MKLQAQQKVIDFLLSKLPTGR